jgi:hypothetical protein
MDLVCSFCITSSGGKDNSSGGSVPRSRIACHSTRRNNSKGRCHNTKQHPDPMWWNIGGYTCLFASPTHDGLGTNATAAQRKHQGVRYPHMQPCIRLRSDVAAVPNPMMAFFTRWELPLGLQSTDPRSTSVGAEPCSTPVFNLFSM